MLTSLLLYLPIAFTVVTSNVGQWEIVWKSVQKMNLSCFLFCLPIGRVTSVLGENEEFRGICVRKQHVIEIM